MSQSKTHGAPITAIVLLLLSLVLAASEGGLFQGLTQKKVVQKRKSLAREGFRRPSYRKFPTLEAAIREASRLGRPIFLDLFAEWCTPCKKLERETFSHPTIAKLLDRYLVVKFDIDQPVGKSITYRYRVNRFPTTLILDPKGYESERVVGYFPPRFFAPPLQATLEKRHQHRTLRAKQNRSPSLEEQLAYAKRMLLRREITPARRLFQKLQTLDPQDQKKIAAAALFGEARTFTRINAYAQALSLLQGLHTRFPQSALRIDAYRLQLACYEKLNRKKDYQSLYTFFQKRYPRANIDFD